MSQPYITLNNNVKIPQLGFGVYLIPEEKTEECVLEALKVGYRHIDTAHMYNNEHQVGLALKKSGIPRKDVFITSKLWVHEYGEKASYEAVKKMLKRLELDYIDLVLLHQPYNDYVGAWKGLEKAYKEGLVKSIGISNFEDENYDEIIKNATIKPVVNQVECHPLLRQVVLSTRMKKDNCIIESWSPIRHGSKEMLEHPLFKELGKKYHKTPVQVMLRWHLDMGYICLIKSEKKERIAENFAIFDFHIDEADMKRISELEENRFFTKEMRKQFEPQLLGAKPKYE